MSDTLYSVITFTAVPLGGTQTVAHTLICNGTHLKPDLVLLQFPDAFEFVSADTTNLTIRNTSSSVGDCTALCQVIHPVMRSFGQSPDDGTFGQHLTPQPFVPGSPNASGGGGGPFQTLVYRPGGTAGENVFTDWTLLMAALAQLQGTRVIQFDDSVTTPIVIPAGGPYDMTNVTWSGRVDGTVDVQIPEGASFTRLRTFVNRINVRFTGATPPIADFSGIDDSVLIDSGAELSSSGTGALMDVGTASSGAVFFVGDQAGFFFITHAVVDVSAAKTVSVFLQGGESTLVASTFSGIVGSTLNIVWATSAPATAVQSDQAGFLGTKNLVNNSKSLNFPSVLITANGTTLNADAGSQLIRVDPTAGAFAVTLPPAVEMLGQTIPFVNVGASANNVTITAGAGDNINGAGTLVVSGANFFKRITSDGVHTWFVTG